MEQLRHVEKVMTQIPKKNGLSVNSKMSQLNVGEQIFPIDSLLAVQIEKDGLIDLLKALTGRLEKVENEHEKLSQTIMKYISDNKVQEQVLETKHEPRQNIKTSSQILDSTALNNDLHEKITHILSRLENVEKVQPLDPWVLHTEELDKKIGELSKVVEECKLEHSTLTNEWKSKRFTAFTCESITLCNLEKSPTFIPVGGIQISNNAINNIQQDPESKSDIESTENKEDLQSNQANATQFNEDREIQNGRDHLEANEYVKFSEQLEQLRAQLLSEIDQLKDQVLIFVCAV
ncbi:hypothetical protein RFI_15095 [Reticulomyxa filosa]|uniref:Uncharacterized protein n=1 Tax=Reticulomyxa filosa TaxID=46433 RepID=X6N8M7_RETFI|nr:hypothetical protein RFI_15095 [Reticulomyxa filosa]|eukprot:ETO22109.1 hypothetical protein RFI_15095 [Reticulomyxa filosa]